MRKNKLLKTCLGYSKAMDKYIIVGCHKRFLIVANVPVTNCIQMHRFLLQLKRNKTKNKLKQKHKLVTAQ